MNPNDAMSSNSPSDGTRIPQDARGVTTFEDVPLDAHSRPSLRRPSTGPTISKWSLGILNDKRTEEVPGTVLLLASNKNEPLGWHPEAVDDRRDSSMPPQA